MRAAFSLLCASLTCLRGDLPGEDRCGFAGTARVSTRVGCDSTGEVTALEDAKRRIPYSVVI